MALQGCPRSRLLSTRCTAAGGESPHSGPQLGKDHQRTWACYFGPGFFDATPCEGRTGDAMEGREVGCVFPLVKV